MIHKFSLKWGSGTRVQKYDAGTEKEWVLTTTGDGSYISDASVEFGSTKCHVLIGRYCSIGHRVVFEVGLNHDYHYATTYPFDDIAINDPININHFDMANKNQIIIGNDVWIGCDVIILGGVHIGNGAVIGAGAVVAKDIPPYSIVVGNPARVIKYRFEPEVIQRLQSIKWWYWPIDKIKATYPLMKNIDRFLASCADCYGDDTVDETVQALQALKEDGYYIYCIVADFNTEDAVWRSVLTDYLDSFREDNKVLLVVETGNPYDDALLTEMAQMVEEKGADAPIVVTHQYTDYISKALLRLVDTYITTKDASSSEVVDLLWDMDAEIVYGLDYGGRIFKKKEVNRSELNTEKKVRIEELISSQRGAVRTLIEQRSLNEALAKLFNLAYLLYEYNQIYTDDDLEEDLKLLESTIIADVISGELNENVVLFYDGFGLNGRGLAEIYLDAIDEAGYDIIYITTKQAEGNIPRLKDVLERNGATEIYLEADGTVEEYQKLSKVISEYRPAKAFLYTTPYDVTGVLAFMHQAGKMVRYQIELNDHAFWLGRNAFDYCLEFRDYGASISANYRKISAEKLIRMNFYPVVDESKSFEGFPFQREEGDFVIFSGGFLYKTVDKDMTYYKIVEHCLQHDNVKFWYAGYGDITELQRLIEKYPGRVFHSVERSDLYAVMENIDMYLTTFPIAGGLMYQYSAIAGRAPITLVNDANSLGFLFGDTELKAFSYSLDDHLNNIDRFITDRKYRLELEKGIEKTVCTREDFINRMRKLLRDPKASEFDLAPINTEDFRAVYRQRILEKINM